MTSPVSTVTMYVKGKLEYLGGREPIRFVDDRNTDLWSYLDALFLRLNDKPVKIESGMNSIEIFADHTSDQKLSYDPKNKFVSTQSKTGWSNTSHYISIAFERLNGQHIILTVESERFKVEVDPEYPATYGLYYTRNNYCLIPEEAVKKHCRPGAGSDTCIFLTSGEDGFECIKFCSSGEHVLSNRRKMTAKRIGDCTILGRNDLPEKPFDFTQPRYLLLKSIADAKDQYIGWTLCDLGDSMDRRMGLVENGGVKTKIKDIVLTPNEENTDVNFSIVGEDYTCGFSFKYGGGVSGQIQPDKINFYGFMGHDFYIAR